MVRVRFSLGTLLILVAVVGVIVGSFVVETRLRRAERELKALRDETGRLTIDDRSQVHAINVAVDEPMDDAIAQTIYSRHKTASIADTSASAF